MAWATVAAIAASAWPARAEAPAFEDVAAGARELPDVAALAGLFWSLTERCGAIENDLRRRQCEGVRARRAGQVTGRTYRVTTDGAVRVGPHDPAEKALPLIVEACVACDAAGAGSESVVVLGRGKHRASGGVIRGAELARHAVDVASAEEAEAFAASVVGRLRTDFVVRVPAKLETFRAGAVAGYKVEIIGFRVYDPCTGDVILTSPPGHRDPAPVDPSTCPARPAAAAGGEKPERARPAEDTGPRLPERVSAAAIREAMRPVQEAARECHEAYGVPGTARFRITFSGEGEILALEQSGEFAGTPTGGCVEKAARKVTFPRSAKARTTILVPVAVP